MDSIEKNREEIIQSIYQFQIKAGKETESDDPELERCGFRGSLSAAFVLNDSDHHEIKGSTSSHSLDTSHITMTYAALNILLILGDDLKGFDRRGIIAGVKALQLSNGR